MKTLLICPTYRPAVARLAESGPLVLSALLGKTVLEHWLEHVAARGDRDVSIIALDRPERIRMAVGDGSRWGLSIEVLPRTGEPAPPEARLPRDAFPASAEDVPGGAAVLDYLPGLCEFPLFESYESWFRAVQFLIPRAHTPDRIGRRELEPGVSVGHQARVSNSARLIGPCWIGDHVYVGPNAVVGPGAVIEDRAFISRGAHVSNSMIGPETFVGQFTRISDSIAQGNRLVNWRTNSSLDVPDAFLLCSLSEPHGTLRPAPLPMSQRAREPLVGLSDLIPRSQG